MSKLMIKHPKVFALLWIPLVAGITFSCEREKLTPVCDGSSPTYTANVKTIISSNCSGSSCHGAGSKRDYSTYELLSQVCFNGKFEKNVLEKQVMPRNGDLSQDEINTLQCWSDHNFPEN